MRASATGSSLPSPTRPPSPHGEILREIRRFLQPDETGYQPATIEEVDIEEIASTLAEHYSAQMDIVYELITNVMAEYGIEVLSTTP